MENEETTVQNNDYDFVDIGGVEQSLSHGNRCWKFIDSVSLPSAEVVFSHKSVLSSFCHLYLFQKCLFTTYVVTRLPFGFQYYPVQLVTC